MVSRVLKFPAAGGAIRINRTAISAIKVLQSHAVIACATHLDIALPMHDELGVEVLGNVSIGKGDRVIGRSAAGPAVLAIKCRLVVFARLRFAANVVGKLSAPTIGIPGTAPAGKFGLPIGPSPVGKGGERGLNTPV